MSANLSAWSPEALARFLRCPDTHEPLSWASPQLLQEVNRRIERGEVTQRLGVVVREPLDAALVNASKTRLYPCYGGLPALLLDETIILEGMAPEKES